MLMTFFVSHFERSPLNTVAPWNAIERDIKRRVHKKGKTISINVFDVQIILIQNMFMNTRTEREKKEREGRTSFHVGDLNRIPFWEISVERRGRLKHYKKRDIKWSVH